MPINGSSPNNSLTPDGESLNQVGMQNQQAKLQHAHNAASTIQHKLDEAGQQIAQNLGDATLPATHIDPDAAHTLRMTPDYSKQSGLLGTDPDDLVSPELPPDPCVDDPIANSGALAGLELPPNPCVEDPIVDQPAFVKKDYDPEEKPERRGVGALLLAFLALLIVLGLMVIGVIIIPNLGGGGISSAVANPVVNHPCTEDCAPVSTEEATATLLTVTPTHTDTPTPTVTVTITPTATVRVVNPSGPSNPDECAAHGGTSYAGDTCVCPGVIDHVIICGDGTKFDNVTSQTCTPNESCSGGGTTGGGGSAPDPTVACGCGLYGAPSYGLGCSNGVIEECNVSCGCKP